MKLKGKKLKFRVNNQEHSERIQKALFALGGTGWNSSAEIRYTNKPFLFLWSNGVFAHSESEDYFKQHKYRESTLEELYRMQLPEKWIIRTPGQLYARNVQNELFKMGYSWGGDTEYKYLGAYYYRNANTRVGLNLTNGFTKPQFDSRLAEGCEEISLNDLLRVTGGNGAPATPAQGDDPRLPHPDTLLGKINALYGLPVRRL